MNANKFHMFDSLNYVITSFTDNAFINSKENTLKEKALIQFFKNSSSNFSGSYKKMKRNQQHDKIRERLSISKKEQILKVFDDSCSLPKKFWMRNKKIIN